MSIRFRFALLFGSLLLGFASALVLQQWLEQREQQRTGPWLQAQQSRLLDHWLKTTAETLERYTAESVAGLAAVEDEANPAWSLGDPAEAGIAAVWVLRPNGSPIRTVAAPGLVRPPLGAETIASWNESPPPDHFFAESEAGLLELQVQRLAPSSPVAGWVIAARQWSESHLRLLSHLAEGTAQLLPAGTAKATHGLLRTLDDWQGRPLRLLQFTPPAAAEPGLWWRISPHLPLFFAFGLLLIAALGLSLRTWVLGPLGQIDASLAGNDPRPILALREDKAEFGRVARLLEEAHAQRDQLRREVERRRQTESALLASEDQLRRSLDERIRLGRDLHDGVIQSLYATGMGLAGIRALLQTDQTEAAARLEQSRAALNATIHDVRNFIVGLEPEALRQQTFAQAVESLLGQMQELRPARCSCEIDAVLAAQLTLSQRANLLQITTEAVSNALRHGEASQVDVSLRAAPDGGAVYAIGDDGRGFDPAREAGGHGRTNLAQRARELGAELTTDSGPGRGTRLQFAFRPIPKS